MEVFFVIPIVDIDPNWMMRGYESSLYALEYSEFVLHVPPEYIKDTSLSESGIEISLVADIADIVDEDWYVKLVSLSHYVHKSS